MVGQADLADVVQRGAAGEHVDERLVDLPGEAGQLAGRLAQAAGVARPCGRGAGPRRRRAAGPGRPGPGRGRCASAAGRWCGRSRLVFELAVDARAGAGAGVGAVLGLLEAQRRVDPAEQLRDAERLAEVVVGPAAQHLGHLVGGRLPGDHDDLEVGRRRVGAEQAEQFRPAHARQVDVEQHEVRRVGPSAWPGRPRRSRPPRTPGRRSAAPRGRTCGCPISSSTMRMRRLAGATLTAAAPAARSSRRCPSSEIGAGRKPESGRRNGTSACMTSSGDPKRSSGRSAIMRCDAPRRARRAGRA